MTISTSRPSIAAVDGVQRRAAGEEGDGFRRTAIVLERAELGVYVQLLDAVRPFRPGLVVG
jgi:hypothetical protein